MINAVPGTSPGWQQHLNGVVAVLGDCVANNRMPTCDIVSLVLGSVNNGTNPPKIRRYKTICNPPRTGFGDLCSILPRVQNLFKESASMLLPDSIRYESTLKIYRDKAIALKRELVKWTTAQPKSDHPKVLQYFTKPFTLQFPGCEDVLCPVMRADVYSNCKTRAS